MISRLINQYAALIKQARAMPMPTAAAMRAAWRPVDDFELASGVPLGSWRAGDGLCRADIEAGILAIEGGA